MSERFFSSRRIAGEQVTLDGPEAHHLLHVMRAKIGDEVTLFDDSGAEFSAIINLLKRSEVELRVIECREIDRELPFSITVGVALPKGDRQKWLVEKLTELGVSTLVPLVTERSVAEPSDSTLDRLRRAVIEAAKQCGRNRLMEISTAQTWSGWIEAPELYLRIRNPQSATRNPLRLVAHPTDSNFADVEISEPESIQLAIGPEGGFTDAEVNGAAAAGWQPVSLGPRILRVETAAIALVAAFSLRA